MMLKSTKKRSAFYFGRQLLLCSALAISVLAGCTEKQTKTTVTSKTAEKATAGYSKTTEKTTAGYNKAAAGAASHAMPLQESAFTESAPEVLPNSASKIYGHPMWTSYELNTDVMALAFDKDVVWVGTEIGLITYDLKQDKILNRYDNKSGLVSNIATVIKIDDKGTKWIGTHGGGLSKFNGKTWEKVNVPNLADPFVYDIVFDKHGVTWVATWKGVSYYNGEQWNSYFPKDGLIDEWVYAITIDNDDSKWFGTEGGVTMLDKDGHWQSYTHKDGLGASRETIGVYEKIDSQSKHHETTPGKSAEGYNPNYVLSAATDKDNTKWFGTWGAGISRFDGKTWTTYSEKDGLPGNFVTDIVIDENDVIWASTDKGIGIYNGKKWLSLNEADGLLSGSVFDIALGPDGKKWFGTMAGISKLEQFRRPLKPTDNHPAI